MADAKQSCDFTNEYVLFPDNMQPLINDLWDKLMRLFIQDGYFDHEASRYQSHFFMQLDHLFQKEKDCSLMRYLKGRVSQLPAYALEAAQLREENYVIRNIDEMLSSLKEKAHHVRSDNMRGSMNLDMEKDKIIKAIKEIRLS